LLFGTLIAATDPVAVIACFKESGVDGRLKLLVEAESLFNDGTAAVAFTLALALATGISLTPVEMAQNILWTIFGGVGIGMTLSWLLLFLAGKTDEHLVETVFTIVAAYGSFILAEEVHCSGILATLTAGLMLGNIGSLGAITDRNRETVAAFWECIAFIANAIIFLLIGVQEANLDLRHIIFTALIAILITTLGRAIAIYPLCAMFQKSRSKVDHSHQHILFWGGLRGALALALALGLPQNLPHREDIIGMAFAVVTFSVFVQGLTITPLLKQLGLLKASEA
jgi:CPA1 family monovalent cation:H+ antiporter